MWGAWIVAFRAKSLLKLPWRSEKELAPKDPLFILAYADDNPGYIPPESDYLRGGYEIDEAHRFYGLGATVAPRTAEHLARLGCKSVEMARVLAAQTRLN